MKPFSTRMRPSTICGMPSGPIVGADARRHRHVGLVLAVAEPHRQHQILGRQLLRLDVDDAVAVLAGVIAARSSHGRSAASELTVSATPPACGRVRLRLMSWKVHCLPLRWSSTVRLPFLRPSSLRSRPSSPVAPSLSIQASKRGEIGNHVAAAPARLRWRARSVLRQRQRHREPARSGVDARRRGHERTLVGAGEHRDLAVGLDAHLHFGADQAQPLGADAAGEQAGAGDADLGLRRARDDGAVGDRARRCRGCAARCGRWRRVRAGCRRPRPDGSLPKFSSIAAVSQGVARSKLDRPVAEPPPQRRRIATRTTAAERAGDIGQPCADARQQLREARLRRMRAIRIGERQGWRCAQRRQRAERPRCSSRSDWRLASSLRSAAYARIRVLIRHAPTGRPLDRRVPLRFPAQRTGSIAACRPIHAQTGRPASTLPLIALTIH